MFSRRLCAIILVGVYAVCFNHHLMATDTASDLQSKVARLNDWLGAGSRAEGWRRYLNLNVLETQSAKGNRADVATLQLIHNRFSSGAPGLDGPAFVLVRDAIRQHILQLSSSQFPNLAIDIYAAQSQFRPVSSAQFDQLKNTAIRDTLMLKWYMKKKLASRERALAFYDLKPDELVAYLKELQLELPPARSREVIDDEIKSLQNRATQVSDRIEQLNEQLKKINQWMQDLEDRKDDDVPPPMPDDDNQAADPKVEEAPDAGKTQTGEPRQDQEIKIDPSRKPQLEMETRTLMDELERINARIKELEQESDKLKDPERERNKRRSKVLSELRERSAGFDKLDGQYNDAYFAAAQDSIQRVVRGYFYATDSGLYKGFQNRIQTILENYPKLADPRERRAAAEVGAALGWLESAMQVPGMVTAIRAKHSLPNLQIAVSSNLINRVAHRPVNQLQPVNEIILSRLIRGLARICGNVNVELVDDPNQVHASLRMCGTVNAETYTQSGRITAYAGSNAQIDVRRSVFANTGGFFATNVYGAAQLGSYFRGVDSRIRLVQKIARKQYLKDKQLAESISARRLENRTIPEFQRQTDEALMAGKQRFQELQKRQAAEAKMIPSLYMFTGQNRLNVVGHKTSLFDLAAPQPAIAGSFVNPDIQVKLHESMLSNYASPLLAGRTFSNEELAERLGQFLGEMPKPEDEESFTITFDTVRPIQFEFLNNTIAAAITGRRFRQDDKVIPDALKIRIQFSVHRGTNGKLYLRRDGNVIVDYVNPEKKNAKTVAFKSFLEGRLNKVAEEGELTNIELPNNLIPVDQVEALKNRPMLRQLNLVQLRIENGWLYAGWSHSNANSAYMQLVDTPAILNDVIINQMMPPLPTQGIAPPEIAPPQE